jgi:hypothetical protein
VLLVKEEISEVVGGSTVLIAGAEVRKVYREHSEVFSGKIADQMKTPRNREEVTKPRRNALCRDANILTTFRGGGGDAELHQD